MRVIAVMPSCMPLKFQMSSQYVLSLPQRALRCSPAVDSSATSYWYGASGTAATPEYHRLCPRDIDRGVTLRLDSCRRLRTPVPRWRRMQRLRRFYARI